MVLVVKCRQCSAATGHGVFHRWPVVDIVQRFQAGELNGVCAPNDERFVHWRVKSAA